MAALKCSLLLSLSTASCSGQKSGQAKEEASEKVELYRHYATLADGSYTRDLFERNRPDPDPLESAWDVRLYITSIAQQRNGDMWFGTHGYGVLHFAADMLTYLNPDQGFMGRQVREMCEDAYGNMWFATADGLICHKAGADLHSFTLFTEREGLPHKDVRSLAIDQQGVLWLGTANGAARIDLTKWAGEGPIDVLSVALPGIDAEPQPERGGTIHSIMEDRQGRMWFGSNHGAHVYDAEAENPWRQLSTRDGLCGDTVRDILEDHQGRMWFATQDDGVCRLDGALGQGKGDFTFTRMETQAGHRGREVSHLYEDARQRLWFTVNGVGTYSYEGDKLRHYFEAQSCISHTFSSTFQDQKGFIWFGGWLGLFRYHEPC